MATEKALFGAGCFWGVEDAFRTIDGVIDVAVGYAGGHKDSPTYRDVCSGKTGHAEVVLVEYDPAQVPFTRLLDAFWLIHDPTTLNRQGPDVGTQYRSAIFCTTAEQLEQARASRDALEAEGRFGDKEIVTEIGPEVPFWRGEEYHQQYNVKNGRPSCLIIPGL